MVLLTFVYRAVSFLFTWCCLPLFTGPLAFCLHGALQGESLRGDGLVGSGCHGFCDFIFGVEDINRYKETCSCLEQ